MPDVASLIGGTVGQPDAGTLTGGTLKLAGGFWLGVSTASGIPDLPAGPVPPSGPAMPIGTAAPTAFRVSPAWPNPLTNGTVIGLDLPSAAPVEARVFSPAGRLVAELCAGSIPAGRHQLNWNGRDGSGNRVASGIYLVLVRTLAGDSRQRVVVIH